MSRRLPVCLSSVGQEAEEAPQDISFKIFLKELNLTEVTNSNNHDGLWI